MAMIGLAVATLFGARRVAEPVPEPGLREDIRSALAAFAQWLNRQDGPIRAAAAGPARALLADGADLVGAITAEDLAHPAVLSAHAAISRDLPATTQLADRLPPASRGSEGALAPLNASLETIARATAAALVALGHDAVTRLEVQQSYLDSKFPGDDRDFDQRH